MLNEITLGIAHIGRNRHWNPILNVELNYSNLLERSHTLPNQNSKKSKSLTAINIIFHNHMIKYLRASTP